MKEAADNFVVRIKTPEGGDYSVELGPGYDDDQVRLDPFGYGIVVRHPGKDPVYINGSTRQVSKDPEVCRSPLIVAPADFDLARTPKPEKSAQMDAVLGPMRKH